MSSESWPAAVLRGLVVALSAFFTLGFACYGLVLSAVWTASWSLVGIRALGRLRVGLVLALLALGGAFWWVPLHEFADATDHLAARLDQGPEAYSTREKLGIYGLHGLMTVVGGVVGLPEVAVEAAGLHVPIGGTRVVHSDFPLRSPKVRRKVAALAGGGSGRVAWTYAWDRESVRVALALNALDLVVEPGPDDALDVAATVQIAYPHRYRLVFFQVRGRTVGIEEGLYGMLQDAGWLFPYAVEYRFRVDRNDPILRDPNPTRGTLERALILLLA